jgi:hypothetical protein
VGARRGRRRDDGAGVRAERTEEEENGIDGFIFQEFIICLPDSPTTAEY